VSEEEEGHAWAGLGQAMAGSVCGEEKAGVVLQEWKRGDGAGPLGEKMAQEGFDLLKGFSFSSFQSTLNSHSNDLYSSLKLEHKKIQKQNSGNIKLKKQLFKA
jgi:hypothetical protein